jgi:cell wall assembly regulator SMI1
MAEPGVTESWQTIVEWLAHHAPAMHAALRGPATEPDLSWAQRKIPTPLPDDLLEWWRLADGVRYRSAEGELIPPCYNPWQVADVLNERAAWLRTRGAASAQARADGMPDPARQSAGTQCYTGWLPTWVPIAYDRFGNALFVDLRPGRLHGCVTEFDSKTGTSQSPLWPSVKTMLAEVATSLKSGTAIALDRPQLADNGRLTWDA